MLHRLSVAAAVASVAAVTGASAADIPVKARPAPVAVAYSWTGCYVGIVAGYQEGRSSQQYGGLVNGVPNAFLPLGTDFAGDYTVNGGHLGGGAGCNYQAGSFVFGVEGDWSHVMGASGGKRGRAAIVPPLNANFEFTTEQEWMATLRGRIGYAWNNWLVYATGGVVWGRFVVNNQNATFVATATRIPTALTERGWIVGGGVEWAANSTWSLKAEGLYAKYDTMHYGDEPGIVNGCTAGCANADVKMDAIIFRVGANYRWHGLPFVGR